MFGLFKRIKKLEDELKEHVDKTKRAFDTCKKTDEKLSEWDDDRRAQIRALAEHLGVSLRTGVHLVEDDEQL
jgi:septal ring factor EnvC (AmiA/AmiB activator)